MTDKTEFEFPGNVHPNAKIGIGTRIASFVYIEGDVVIGNNCKIKPFSFICDGVTIENDCFIGPGVTFSNDKYPRATTGDRKLKSDSDWKLEKTLIKKGASIGANATIVGPVTIGENAMIGAGAIISKDVASNQIVIGNNQIIDIIDNKKLIAALKKADIIIKREDYISMD